MTARPAIANRKVSGTLAEVRFWGRTIGAVYLEKDARTAVFQYTPEFAGSGIEVSPLEMPLATHPYSFPELAQQTFHGLPGLLADSLPDRYGNALIDAWLERQGRRPDSFNAVERLCYVGSRGMGALEFRPTLGPEPTEHDQIHVARLAELADQILSRRTELTASLEDEAAVESILKVGTSAGGARAKAIIAWNPETSEVRSGHVDADGGFEYWVLKFDGVTPDRDRELGGTLGYGAIEYAYSLMAKAAGINIPECRLYEEGGRRHFMSKRFDRGADGSKIHMQSLGALAHYDFNLAGAYSYEQAMRVIRRISGGMDDIEELFRRAVFNIVTRNQDDHVKNISYLMDRTGAWRLSPAYDVTYSFNPSGTWTSSHQMSLNGKRDEFTREDFRAAAGSVSLLRGSADELLDEVVSVACKWPDFAAEAGVPGETVERIRRHMRLDWG